MTMRTGKVLLALAIAAPAAMAIASETINYRYDARGRLIRVEHSGAVNNNVNTNYAIDPADNRTSRQTGVGLPPEPQPPPPPGNQPPVAVNDAGGMSRCADAQFAVLSNDSDPDGNLPLALVSVSGGGARGTPSISGTNILFSPNEINGTAIVDYTMRDSLGATASATLTITITNGACGPPP